MTRTYAFDMQKLRLSGLFAVTAAVCAAQIAPSAVTSATQMVYLKPGRVPMAYRTPMAAVGSRMQNPGAERFTLSGTYSDASGRQHISIVWQLGGKTLVNLGALSLIFDGTTTSSTAGAPTDAQNDLLESLGDDRPETALYGLTQSGFTQRCLGGWFRTDNGTNKSYKGPWYAIYQTLSPVAVRADNPTRAKLRLYDAPTGLFAAAQYNITRNGQRVAVETSWTNWTTVNGQAVPGQIVRQENGTTVFTVNVTSGVVSAAASDNLVVVPSRKRKRANREEQIILTTATFPNCL